jgi:hypothetical protein
MFKHNSKNISKRFHIFPPKFLFFEFLLKNSTNNIICVKPTQGTVVNKLKVIQIQYLGGWGGGA